MQLLGAEPQRAFTLAEIGRALGISRATGHAILSTLAEHDWVVRDLETGGYAWGPAIGGAGPAGGQRGPVVPRSADRTRRRDRHAGAARPAGRHGVGRGGRGRGQLDRRADQARASRCRWWRRSAASSSRGAASRHSGHGSTGSAPQARRSGRGWARCSPTSAAAASRSNGSVRSGFACTPLCRRSAATETSTSSPTRLAATIADVTVVDFLDTELARAAITTSRRS